MLFLGPARMDENLEYTDPLRPVDHLCRSETIGWVLMVGLAFLVFELTADSSLAVVLGCLKFLLSSHVSREQPLHLDCRGIVSPGWHSRLVGCDGEIGHEEGALASTRAGTLSRCKSRASQA